MAGLGLIGGSALRALAAAGHRVRGYDADPATRAAADQAATGSAADQAATGTGGTGAWQVAGSLAEAVDGAELVLLAVPLPALPEVLDELATTGYAGLVSDVTSVKGPVLDLVHRRPGNSRPGGRGPGTGTAVRFVGGHPMAGREVSGFAAADPDLFTGCAWVLCLEPESTPVDDWLPLADVITGLGARVVPTTAAEHDRAVAAISHVPHLLAAALAARAATDPLAMALAAGSFRDGTRVAASPPALVAAMCGGNAPTVAPVLDEIRSALTQARAALDGDDPIGALRDWLAPGYAARSGWPPHPGDTVELAATPEKLLELGRTGGWVTAVVPDRGTVTAVRPRR